MSLLRQGKAQALTIYLAESDQWEGLPLYVAIVQFLRSQGSAGATVTRAVSGYGASFHVREQSGHAGWSSEAPIVIQVIDQPRRLHRLLPRLEEMLSGGLVTLHDVEVLKYTHAHPRGLQTSISVQQIMETILTTVQPGTPIARVIDLLLEVPFQVLPVVDARQILQGVISVSDLIKADVFPLRRQMLRAAMALEGEAAATVEASLRQARRSNLTAQDVMNRHVRTISPEASIREAGRLMLEAGLRALPVVSTTEQLLGMVTRSDLLQVVVTSPLMSSQTRRSTQPLPALSDQEVPIQERPIVDYLNADVMTVEEQTPLTDVLDLLVLSPYRRVLVVDRDRHVHGIISDVDILSQMQAEERPSLLQGLMGWLRRSSGSFAQGTLHKDIRVQTAGDVMNRNVIVVQDQVTVQETVERMIQSHRKVLPVVDQQQRLLGMVGRSDLLRTLLET